MPFLSEFRNGYGGKTTFEYQDGPIHEIVVDPEWPVNQLIWQAVVNRKIYDGRTPGEPEPPCQSESYSGTNGHWLAYEDPQHPDFRGFNIVTHACPK